MNDQPHPTSNSTSNPPSPSPPKPHRSPSDPTPPTLHQPQRIYVLSADGSSLFLLDPSKPQEHEEPPPYMPFQPTAPDHVDTDTQSNDEDDGPDAVASDTGIGRRADVTERLARPGVGTRSRSTPGTPSVVDPQEVIGYGASIGGAGVGREAEAGPSVMHARSTSDSPARSSTTANYRSSTISQDRARSRRHTGSAPIPSIPFPISTSDHLLPGHTARHSYDPNVEHGHHTRHRASTLSAIQSRQTPAGYVYSNLNNVVNTGTNTVGNNPGELRRPRYHTSYSAGSAPQTLRRGTRSAVSSPGVRHAAMADESTPLLGYLWTARGEPSNPGRGMWKSIFCGDVDVDEEVEVKWGIAWRRFWRPWARREYWRAVLHLVLLNFPFALLVWPFLLAGTLAGTALLITLPIGAAVWWLTLFISRSAARLETIMQLHFHRPPLIEPLTYRPIFYRPKDRSLPQSPISHPSTSGEESPRVPETQWERRFMKCSYAMFLDHYSYSALSYFLLIKPLITLFSTIAIVALLPICFVGIFTFPIYLRALRRWGKWQAKVALENL